MADYSVTVHLCHTRTLITTGGLSPDHYLPSHHRQDQIRPRCLAVSADPIQEKVGGRCHVIGGNPKMREDPHPKGGLTGVLCSAIKILLKRRVRAGEEQSPTPPHSTRTQQGKGGGAGKCSGEDRVPPGWHGELTNQAHDAAWYLGQLHP